jgi:hypothetical protein
MQSLLAQSAMDNYAGAPRESSAGIGGPISGYRMTRVTYSSLMPMTMSRHQFTSTAPAYILGLYCTFTPFISVLFYSQQLQKSSETSRAISAVNSTALHTLVPALRL